MREISCAIAGEMDFYLKCQNFSASFFSSYFPLCDDSPLRGRMHPRFINACVWKEWQKSVCLQTIRFISKFYTWNRNWYINLQPTIWALVLNKGKGEREEKNWGERRKTRKRDQQSWFQCKSRRGDWQCWFQHQFIWYPLLQCQSSCGKILFPTQNVLSLGSTPYAFYNLGRSILSTTRKVVFLHEDTF